MVKVSCKLVGGQRQRADAWCSLCQDANASPNTRHHNAWPTQCSKHAMIRLTCHSLHIPKKHTLCAELCHSFVARATQWSDKHHLCTVQYKTGHTAGTVHCVACHMPTVQPPTAAGLCTHSRWIVQPTEHKDTILKCIPTIQNSQPVPSPRPFRVSAVHML